MSRLIIFSIFIGFLNSGYSQFFYFQNPEYVTLVNYNLENWRSLDENEFYDQTGSVNGIIQLNGIGQTTHAISYHINMMSIKNTGVKYSRRGSAIFLTSATSQPTTGQTINYLELKSMSGNISAGKVKLYGLKKSV